MTLKKLGWILIGCIGLVLGAVGAILPILPTFPFIALAAFSFARSSQRLHTCLLRTSLYKEYVQPFLTDRRMTRQAKLRTMVTITLFMGLGFTIMWRKGMIVPAILLGLVWVGHIVYFIWRIETKP